MVALASFCFVCVFDSIGSYYKGDAKVYSAKLSIINLDKTSSAEFEQAAHSYVENLNNVADLQVDVSKKKVEGTRGDLSIWADIIITAVSTGTFMAIYTLAKDMVTLYANAEVELTFEDGSSIKLKHLTQKEAEDLIKKHLGRKTSE